MSEEKTVMLIDDEITGSLILSEALSVYGYDCVVFDNPTEALDQCAWLPPDAIVTDMEMPQMTGIEFCRALRDRLGNEMPPVILLSGVSNQETIEEAFKAGAVDYVTKPAAAGLISVKLKQATGGRNSTSFPKPDRQPIRLGDYVIEREIGRGGMGVVYRARNQVTNKVSAIKTFLSGSDNLISLLRFRREIDLLVTLKHKNLIQVYESGRFKEVFFYSMEYIEGGTLGDVIDKVGALPALDIVTILLCMADALAVVHNQDLIHRDIKTANILMCPERGAILSDFGLSKAKNDHQLTASNQIVGTPHFMSPEMIVGGEIDARSDLFSLGMVALEMLMGGPVFEYENSYQIMRCISESQYPKAQDIECAKDYPLELLKVVDKLLERNIKDRIQSAEELRTSLIAIREDLKQASA